MHPFGENVTVGIFTPPLSCRLMCNTDHGSSESQREAGATGTGF